MGFFFKITALLAVVAATSASEYLRTWPAEWYLNCAGKQLIMPPPGYWPEITSLYPFGNWITELPTNSLSGFPNVEILSLDSNILNEFDFGELVDLNDLSEVWIRSNEIVKLIPPPKGTTLESVTSIDAFRNQITQLNRDFFLFAPNLKYLDIMDNPLILDAGLPIINHPNLEILTMGSRNSNLVTVDSNLLSGLPNLKRITLTDSNVNRVEGAFDDKTLLEEVDLGYNSITQITSGTFAPKGRIRGLFLQGNPLTRLDTAALNNAMGDRGRLYIDNTPLACNCGWEALYSWATTKMIFISATCTGQPTCTFTRRLTAPLDTFDEFED